MARRIATEITRTGYPTKNIFRSINWSLCPTRDAAIYVCAFWGIFMHQGCRTQRWQNHWINIFHYHHDHCFAGTRKISHERHKWNTFHIHVLNSTTYLTFINHTFDCESEVVVLIGKSHDLNRVTYKNGFKREHFCQGTHPFYCKNWILPFPAFCLCILTCNDISTHIFKFWRHRNYATLIIMHRVNYRNMQQNLQY